MNLHCDFSLSVDFYGMYPFVFSMSKFLPLNTAAGVSTTLHLWPIPLLITRQLKPCFHLFNISSTFSFLSLKFHSSSCPPLSHYCTLNLLKFHPAQTSPQIPPSHSKSYFGISKGKFKQGYTPYLPPLLRLLSYFSSEYELGNRNQNDTWVISWLYQRCFL